MNGNMHWFAKVNISALQGLRDGGCWEGRDIRVVEHLSCALVIERASPGVSSRLKGALRPLNGRNEKIVWF